MSFTMLRRRKRGQRGGRSYPRRIRILRGCRMNKRLLQVQRTSMLGATLDIDATLSETHKQEALYAMKVSHISLSRHTGRRQGQVYPEFRDGTSAGYDARIVKVACGAAGRDREGAAADGLCRIPA
jgi:hypothetical protein